MLKDLLPIIFIIPLLVIMIIRGRVYDKYRDLYQGKLKPTIPVSSKALNKDFENNSLGFVKKIPMISLIGLKLEFGHVDDPELKKLQRKLRICSMFFVSYAIISMTIIFVVNAYF